MRAGAGGRTRTGARNAIWIQASFLLARNSGNRRYVTRKGSQSIGQALIKPNSRKQQSIRRTLASRRKKKENMGGGSLNTLAGLDRVTSHHPYNTLSFSSPYSLSPQLRREAKTTVKTKLNYKVKRVVITC